MTYIVSNGRVVPTASKAFPYPSANTYYTGPTGGYLPLLRADGSATTYEAMYRLQPWVYAVVNKRVSAVARMPLKTYIIGDGDTHQRVPSHPLARLIRRPAPLMTEWKLKAHLMRSLDVHGHAVALKVREAGPGSPVIELYPMPWENVTMISDDSGPLEYRIRIGALDVPLGPEEVVHISLPDGVSPLQPLARTLALEDAAQTWQGQSLRNGVTPRGAFTTDQRLADNVIPRLRAELEQMYAGPENAGRFGIFDNGLKFQAMGQSAVDAELIEQRKLSREEVCAVYDVPPPLVGIYERATYSNMVEARRALFDSIASRLALIEETLNVQLVSDVPAWDGLFLEFDTRELLRLDPEAQARTDLMEQQSSGTSINERRRTRNLPPINDPIADAVMVPVNMLPVGEGVTSSFPALGSTTAGTPEQGQTTPQSAALDLAIGHTEEK